MTANAERRTTISMKGSAEDGGGEELSYLREREEILLTALLDREREFAASQRV